MALLDVFNSDAYSVISLTTAILKLPYMPTRLGRLNLFTEKSVATTTVMVEEQEGKLALLQTARRGDRSRSSTWSRDRRHSRTFAIPHVPQDDALLADSLQGIRAFGRETDTEVFATVMNDKLAALRQNHEVTFEWHRIGALKGLILDADGSTLYDLFSEFGVTQQEVEFDFTNNGTWAQPAPVQDMKMKSLEVIRLMQSQLGATTLTGVRAICGDTFFDEFIKHPTVKTAWERQQDAITGMASMGQFLRNQQTGYDTVRDTGFEFGGIVWENYRGSVGSVDFIDTNQAHFYPTGVPGLFEAYKAPADYVETVNTMGKLVYAKQERMKFDKGVEIESQSNVLWICTRPGALILGSNATPSTTTEP